MKRIFKKYPAEISSVEGASYLTSSTTSVKKYYRKVKQLFEAVASIWKKWADIDIQISDDGVLITYVSKYSTSDKPFHQRVDVRLIPEYHLYNYLDDKVLITTDVDELSRTVSDIIDEDIH